jgi:hypothetical protein
MLRETRTIAAETTALPEIISFARRNLDFQTANWPWRMALTKSNSARNEFPKK